VLKAVRKKIIERENLGSTGIGNGIAVPHVKDRGIERISLVLARSNDGIDFAAVDGRDVNTVFTIFAPEDHADEHLQILRWISVLARNADFRSFVRNASGEAEIRDLLHEMSPE
jgi:PTS system nitrogen regulatory IIA component